MNARKLPMLLVCCTILLLTVPIGQCFSPYNPEGAGILCILPGPYSQEVKSISRNNLQSLWFYDLTLEAESDIIHVTKLGIIVEAHNCVPNTPEAMLFSQLNTEQIWAYVQHLNINQRPISKESDFVAQYTQRLGASNYRKVPAGEAASQKNLFVAEFKNIDIIIKPGEKVVLSFFGKFVPDLPSGTKIKGGNLIPLWVCTAKDMKTRSNGIASEFNVK